MSQPNQVVRDIFLTGLRNQHGVENQAIELLERQIGRLDDYPELADKLRQHLAESKEQAQRIDQLLQRYDESASSLKDTVLSAVGNLAAMLHAPSDDEIIKNTLANFAFEHYEIASYKALITLSDVVGDGEAGRVLQLSLKEEEAMAAWINDRIAPTTRRYVEQAVAKQAA